MSEFIITSDQLERLIDGVEHDTGRKISRVVARGTELPEVVRCRDCEHFEQGYTDGAMFDETVCWAWDNGHDYPHFTNPDGFCYQGERRADA